MSTAEVIKLDNLKHQEEMWQKLEIEESIQEAKTGLKKNVSNARMKKLVQPEDKVNREKEASLEDSLEGVSTCEEVRGVEFQGEEVQGEEFQGEKIQGEEVRGEEFQGEKIQGEEVQGEEVQGEEFQGEKIQGEDVRV